VEDITIRFTENNADCTTNTLGKVSDSKDANDAEKLYSSEFASDRAPTNDDMISLPNSRRKGDQDMNNDVEVRDKGSDERQIQSATK